MEETLTAKQPAAGGQVQKWLARCFYAVYFVTFGWVVLNIALTTTGNNIANMALAFLMGLGLWLLWRGLARRVDTLPKKTLYIFVGVVFGLCVAFHVFMTYFLLVPPVADFQRVYDTAWEMLDTGKIQYYLPYFWRYPNNLGLLLMYVLWYWPFSLFGLAWGTDAALFVGGLLNVLMMNASIFVAWRLARLLFKRESAGLLVLLMCFLFLPYILWSGYFYSDTLSMLFPVLGLFLYIKGRDATGAKAWLLYVGSGLVLSAGISVKGSIAVVAIAVVVHTLVFQLSKGRLLKCAAMLGALLVFQGGYNLFVYNNSWFDTSELEARQSPITVWLALGAYGDGGFIENERFEEIWQYTDPAERSRSAVEWMLESYGQRNETELTAFLTQKAVRTWGQGDYDAFEYMAWPQQGNWSHIFFIPSGPLHQPVRYLCSAYNLLLVSLLAVALFFGLRRGRFTYISVVHITLFGIFLFFSFWETRARILLNVTPLIILAAAGGLMELDKVLPRRRSKAEKNAVGASRGALQ